MSSVWLNEKSKTVEGHTNTATLYFKGEKIVGPFSCHDNTVDIQTALRQVDDRMELRLARKDKTVEGHTRAFNIKHNGKEILSNHSCHDNMESLVNSINTIWKIMPPSS
ncbi:hypothetical protein MCOR25_008667 [Pyricularia grisea]|uniref:Uncharacterized protein n=1 Tax=Pyricularia grisea TaxID=148305 RepID=A0A6P8B0B8_PYRGI|nr:uncharacterized protein PgNI_07405 [Pyricularia grisea]KAI6354344.1 hypothetical protein MCOR25_008667 [Pyricularia grisea]TLD08266.1 hypothetical protein PgNI_07405 [Pyricularia grisea]